MISLLKSLFKSKPVVDYSELMKNGAIIIDVRTNAEFRNGHIEGSINIPIDKIDQNLNKLKSKDQVIITCCASGTRSKMAQSGLKTRGYVNVYNGGSWFNLNRKIK